MTIGSATEMNMRSSLSDIELKPKSDLTFNETDPEKRIQKQKTEFLTMLTTQLKNQDPFSPMDTNTMSQQIFAINQVEQQLETNKLLGSINKLLTDNHMSNSVNYMGKAGFFEGNSFIVSNPQDPSILKYDVKGDAESATVKIFDMKGKEVHAETVNVRSGKNGYIWKPAEGTAMGLYKYHVDLKHKDNNNPATATTYGFGKIDAITSDKGQYTFEVNGEQINPDKFTQIVDNT